MATDNTKTRIMTHLQRRIDLFNGIVESTEKLDPEYALTYKALVNELTSLRGYVSDLHTPGQITHHVDGYIPEGWLKCDGREVSRIGETQRLFEAIGTTYGDGNGATTFNLPPGEIDETFEWYNKAIAPPGKHVILIVKL